MWRMVQLKLVEINTGATWEHRLSFFGIFKKEKLNRDNKINHIDLQYYCCSVLSEMLSWVLVTFVRIVCISIRDSNLLEC